MGIPEEDANDLAQQTFVVVVESVRFVPSSPRLQRLWLSEICFRLAMNFLRLHRHAREEIGCERVAEQERVEATVEATVEARQILRFALEGTSFEDLALLFQHYVEGATLDEIGARLGITRGAVGSRLRRIRRTALKRARFFRDQRPEPTA